MEKEDFLKNFANQFDDIDAGALTFETNFHGLDEWSSLIALAVLNMIEKKYAVRLNPNEMKVVNTVQELYDLVYSKL